MKINLRTNNCKIIDLARTKVHDFSAKTRITYYILFAEALRVYSFYGHCRLHVPLHQVDESLLRDLLQLPLVLHLVVQL
jgi:hypothetical protein